MFFSQSWSRFLIFLSLQIALGIIISWGHTIYAEFELLAGKSAPHDFLQLLVYKTATFTDEIEKIDTVRAYHVRNFQYVNALEVKKLNFDFSEWTCEYIY